MGYKVFPPTYLDGPYATEARVINGERVQTVLLDSVQSQANRMELALLKAVRRGIIELPLWQVDFTKSSVGDVGIISALEAPHRLSDAIFRDAKLDGKEFPNTPQGLAIETSTSQNATALLEFCPTALLFGMWHSTGKQGGMGAKFARAIVSEIVGISCEQGTRAAGRLDPLNISSKAEVFVKEKDVNHWQSEAAKEFKKKSPAEINHGNIPPVLPPEGEPVNGGVTVREAVQITVLSLPALRRLAFPLNEKTTAEANLAAQAMLVVLGLAASEMAQLEGFDLRSRCLLDGRPGSWELLDRGQATPVDLTSDAILKTYSEAVQNLRKVGFKWAKEAVRLEPQEKLVNLVKRSREIQAQGPEES
jgi:CRISPR-associated protein Csb1